MSVSVKFEDNNKLVLEEEESKKYKILTAIGLKAVSIWAKLITTKRIVDTGRFRNSTRSEVDKKTGTVIVGSAVFYAPFLELGTSKMRARPTLRPAILENKQIYEKLAKQILEE